MSFIGGLLGIGGNSGSNFQAQGANLGQANGAQNNVQAGLNQQQQFLQNLLGSQAGLSGNNQAVAQQSQLAQQLAGVNGIGNQQNVYNQQQALAGQLQNIANGQGPNPAQAMLAQATGQNVANQAALMAGQRGSGANAGLIARQAGQQGAATQQQAVGQGASLQAQQSLNALGQIGQQYQNMGNIAGQQIGEQQGANAYLGQLSNAQVGQQLGALGQQQQAAQANQNAILGNIANQNQTNAGIQEQVAGGQQNLLGQATGGLGTVANLAGNAIFGSSAPAAATGYTSPSSSYFGIGAANGGVIGYAQGGAVDGPKSVFGKHLIANPMAKGGKVPVMLSPGEKVLSPEQAREVAKGKMDAKKATTVPGKAKVKGDSEKNDNYPTQLNAGDVVVPRTKAKDSDKAAKFVGAVLAKSHKIRK
jgi:hypothetical protein